MVALCDWHDSAFKIKSLTAIFLRWCLTTGWFFLAFERFSKDVDVFCSKNKCIHLYRTNYPTIINPFPFKHNIKGTEDINLAMKVLISINNGSLYLAFPKPSYYTTQPLIYIIYIFISQWSSTGTGIIFH